MGYAARLNRERGPMIESATGWRPFAWRFGPIWTAVIGAPRSGDERRAVEAVTCLLDTGSSHTFATCAVFERLALAPTGDIITVRDAEKTREQQNFCVDLAIPSTVPDSDGMLLRNWHVSDSAPLFGEGRPGYELVIGCDVLQFCRFTIDGPRGLFRLERA